uniref:Reverse transcriptase domain-containing protein n=1 Tax=Fagus sylvatica TaxID=28930 RepID=A0A2N9GNN9_FAGSY
MKALGWNCRGICNTSTVRALRAHLKGHHPEIIFLSETKADEVRMEKVRKSIGFTDMKVISSNGRAGGLCMMWLDSVKVNVIEFDDHIIAIEIIDGVCDWVLVGFYGPPYAVKRKGVWENLSAFLESVKGPWAWKEEIRGSECVKLYRKQHNTRRALKKWNKEVFGYCQTRISNLMQQIQEIQKKENSEENFKIEASLQSELNEWLLRNEVMWRQKSRETWLREGDKNSKFFHLSTVIRRRRNAINIIKSDGGEWITEKKRIREHFQAKFIEHFSEEEVEFPPDLEGLVPHSITTEENEELCRIPTPQEIKKALFDMPTLKAPRPRRLLPEVNNSSIVLIPKIPNPTSVNHFRPISLCNVVYKTIAKILVARIRPLLHKLISPCQSAFIPGRWIAENGVIVHEMLHSFKKRKVKNGLMAIKLDLQKAYDRVNWNFLQAVLRNFGFNDIFVGWIMECITSVSYALLINGGKTKSFIPSRGLRQGDPLFPYLFILSQDILSRIIENQFNGGGLSGVKASIGSPAITHVMYADDIVMFSKATRNEASNLNHCIEKYCKWSGQLAQALPTYTMSIFEVPKKICENLDAVTRRFWWNPKTPSGRFLAWKSWDALCLPKKDGGLGFRKNKNFNKALLAKLAWMVVSNRNSICMKLVRSKYKVRGDWLFKDPVKNSSPLWRAIEKTKKLITKGACFFVGDGTSINVWKDPWIPWLQDFKARPKNDNDQQFPIMVSSLIDSNSHCWKQELLEQLFDSTTKEAINKITIPLRPRNDKIVWLLEKNGLFSVKSAYNLCQNLPNTNQNAVEWSKIWKLKAHERSKMFLWRIAANVLPTKDLLAKRVGNMDTLCNLCNEEVETCSHLFFKCNVARAIWYGCKWSLRSDEINVNRNEEIVKIVIDPPWKLPKESREQVSLQMIITLEAIWNLRNQITHNGGEINLISTIKGIEARVQEFLLSQELPPQHIHMDVTKWSTPPPNVVKLNVDAAILRNHSTLAVIARNDKGEVLKAWAKQSKCCDPLQAETSAILWALQLAASESFMHIIIEGDAKEGSK